jgi:hypothetical protein
MKPARAQQPAPSSGPSQIGTIMIGSVAGLAICAIATAILAQAQAAGTPPPAGAVAS